METEYKVACRTRFLGEWRYARGERGARESAFTSRACFALHPRFVSKKKIAYYSRQSLPRSLNKRRRMEPHLSELEVERTGKGSREGKEKRGRTRCDTWKGETNNSWWRLPAAKGFLRRLGRNEMRNSYLYSRCKGLAQIAYYSRQSLPRSLNKRRRNGTAPRSWTLGTS